MCFLMAEDTDNQSCAQGEKFDLYKFGNICSVAESFGSNSEFYG